MFSWDDIHGVLQKRMSEEGALKRRMIEVRDRYNADYVVPLPSVEGQPEMSAPVPNLVADGIDNLAMMAASVVPSIYVPAIDPTKERGVRSMEFARTRKRWLAATWYHSGMKMHIRRFYRHLSAYGSFSLMVVPDYAQQRARIEVRNPLTAYPERRNQGDVSRPANVGYLVTRSWYYLWNKFPQSHHILNRFAGDREALWDVVEWIDADHIVIGILGPRSVPYSLQTAYRDGELGMELARFPNRVGYVPGCITDRVTLDRIAGLMEAIIPNVDLLGELMALDVLAAKKAVFPDRYVIGSNGRPPQLISGEWKDGRTGKTNILADVDQLGELQSSPGPLTHAVADRVESAARQSGGIHPGMSGLTSSNLRTGRAIDSHLSFSIEPRIQEMHEMAEIGLTQVNEAIIDLEKNTWPNKTYHVFSGWASDTGHVEYTPAVHGESNENVVQYPFPGTDLQGSSVLSAQLVGAKMLSRRTAMAKHPYIDDPEAEYRMTMSEELEAAVVASLQQGAVNGTLPLIDIARIKQLIQEGVPPEEAVLQADKEARERQATPAPEAPEGMATAPEQQPGLAPPGAGAEQPPPNINPPPQGLQNFRQMLVALRSQ